jgi:hypothetical protein
VGKSGVISKTRQLVFDALGSGEPDALAQDKLTDWVRAIGVVYNRAHPDHPVQRVQLLGHSVRLTDRAVPRTAGTVIWQADIEQAR